MSLPLGPAGLQPTRVLLTSYNCALPPKLWSTPTLAQLMPFLFRKS